MDSINNACKFGSDAWLELQAFKTRQLNRREKLNRHKNLHKDLINGISNDNHNHHQQHLLNASNQSGPPNASPINSLAGTSRNLQQHQGSLSSTSQTDNSQSVVKYDANNLDTSDDKCQSNNNTSSPFNSSNTNCKSTSSSPTILDYNNISTNEIELSTSPNLELVECLLLLKLCDVALKLPIDSKSLQRSICRLRGLETTSQSLIGNLLQKFAHQELITIEEPTTTIHRNNPISGAKGSEDDEESCIYVTSADHTKLVEFDKSFGSLDNIRALLLESKSDESNVDEGDVSANNIQLGSVPIQCMRTTNTTSSSSSLSVNSPGDENSSSKKTYDSSRSKQQSDKDHNNSSNSNLSNPSSSLFSKQSIRAPNKHLLTSTGDDVESLLSLSSTREKESKKLGEELLELLSKPTAKERNLLESFRSADGYQVQEFCAKGTKGECNRNNNGAGACDKLHFKKIIAKHTEESLGDCSFLNTCFHMDSCKYVHYEVDYSEKQSQQHLQQKQHQFKRPHPAESQNKQHRIGSEVALCNTTSFEHANPSTSSSSSTSSDNNNNNNSKSLSNSISLPGTAGKYTLSPEEQAIIDAKNRKRFKTVLYPPQWIQCDLRFFDMSLLGKFSVVMADPPWDIHMELPYGTMSDDEMRKLNIPALQDEGVIFLWVTGRAMELGRECLALWGYERCDEIIWVKTNQLQRIIRTGRTGHWLNHGKEHCLVGVKGNPKDINRGLDCDVIVAEVRATSHKPDEIYGIIERLSPGTRKIELFGRAHNVQPNWITLGNQLNGVRLIEPSLVNAFKKLNLPFQTIDHTA